MSSKVKNIEFNINQFINNSCGSKGGMFNLKFIPSLYVIYFFKLQYLFYYNNIMF